MWEVSTSSVTNKVRSKGAPSRWLLVLGNGLDYLTWDHMHVTWYGQDVVVVTEEPYRLVWWRSTVKLSGELGFNGVFMYGEAEINENCDGT